jgi:hypothetical protein
METYNFPNHRKGDTFKAREIVLGFDITGATIKMQFKIPSVNQVVFAWLTSDNTFTITNAVTGTIEMTSRILDFAKNTYVYDFQVTDANGNVTTYFDGSIKIIQDITV